MAEGQSSAMAQSGASMARAAEVRENCLKPGEDERVTVAEPSAETASPFHSILALEVGCGRCDKAQPLPQVYQGTCFLLRDLNCAANKEYIIFATAAHNLVCNDCGDWLWVRIYKDLSAPPLTRGKISRKNDYGGLIVPTWYENNAKDPEKTNELFLHDYGIIAVKTSEECPLVRWADKKLLGVATQCKKTEDDVRMCGYPSHTYYGDKEETAKKCKYWVDKPRPAAFAEHDHQLHHLVDSTPGQSGSPVFLLPKEGEAETASATGYVVGIHVAGGTKHNYAVKMRDEHGHDTKPMADLREWAKNPSAFLPEESVAVVCSEKSVKPGVRRSEQKGLHGRRLHQQQSVMKKYLHQIVDKYELGNKIGKHMSNDHCGKLAKMCVKKREKQYVDTYEIVVQRFIKVHAKGDADVTNIPGVIFYLIAGDYQPTCQDFRNLIKDAGGEALAVKVEEIIKELKPEDWQKA
ncbi:uncharacterized protein LOC135829470 [Sycon ciliatum]|uniref:uncharacterized protein LOC135829470 n=1 Tax=Sycon ciliatum TaxID=27933 RepID=UPI0031F71065